MEDKGGREIVFETRSFRSWRQMSQEENLRHNIHEEEKLNKLRGGEKDRKFRWPVLLSKCGSLHTTVLAHWRPLLVTRRWHRRVVWFFLFFWKCFMWFF